MEVPKDEVQVNTTQPVEEPKDGTGENRSEGTKYKNESLGFSFDMPKDWNGKYAVKEEKDGVYVYFKPVEPASEGDGLLFAVIKQDSLEDESAYDNVGEPRSFKAKGITYIVGGPTDIGFPETHKEFNDYIKMKQQVAKVVKTIKTID